MMLKIGLIGCGNIGKTIVEYVSKRPEKFRVKCVFDVDLKKAKELSEKIDSHPGVVEDILRLLEADVDVVVEAASQDAVRDYAVRILDAGKNLMVMSVGALLDDKLLEKIREASRRNNCVVYLPSGALCGLDGLKSASAAGLKEVHLTTRKPPKAFDGVKYVKDRGIKLDSIKKPVVIYDGLAREAVKLLPQNINVCAVLSLVGVGADKTKVTVIADPTVERNVHEVFVRGDFGEFRVETSNNPLPENPKTSYLAALSAIKTLEQIEDRIKIGT